MPWSECDKWAGNGRAWLPKKFSPALDASQKPYYCVSKYPHISVVLPRRPCLALHRRALPVHLPPTIGKASALVGLMTRCSQTKCDSDGSCLSAAFPRPGRAPAESRNHRVSTFAIGVDRTRISCRCCWNYRTACDFPRRKSHIIVLRQCCAAGNPGSDRPFRGFLPRKTTPRDLYPGAKVIAKVL
jgi:hypothetical protein